MAVLVHENEIILTGTVGFDFWDDHFTSGEVIAALAQVGRSNDVTVRLNSGGGYATEGAAIHAALRAHKGEVTVIVEGVAASAASLIAVAGANVQMSLGAVLMIHDPSTLTWGTAADHERTLEMLGRLGEAYAETYAEKTGAQVAEMRDLMRAETWMTAQEAVDRKFADGLAAANSNDPAEPTAFAYGAYAKAPEKIVALANAKGWNARGPLLSAKPASSTRSPSTAAQPPAAPTANNPRSNQEPTMADDVNETEVRTDERTKATARIKAIMTSDEAKGREAMAEHLAYDTDHTSDAAIALLKVAPKAAAPEASGDAGEQFLQRKEGAADGLGSPTAQLTGQAAAKASWAKAVASVNKRVQGAR